MSSPLAIAGVTAVLRNLLDDSLIRANVSGSTGSKVTVTALPPDVIKIDGVNAQSQLNLFLHQVTPNAAWRNAGLPSRDDRGARLSNAPLALDLHYLLTAYGAEELHAEILLGYAMQVLHETPILDRQAIRDALAGGTLDTSILPTALQALSASDLADQVELIKITPSALTSEEMSRLWSALQAHYRPTAAYQASVVLIEARKATRSALPVLTRGARDPVTHRERGITAGASLLPPFPAIISIELPDGQVAARLGDTITLRGHHLDGTGLIVRFEHPRRADPIEIAVGASADPAQVSVAVPSTAQAAIDWPAGAWSVTVAVTRPGESDARTTNALPVLLAPRLDLGTSTATRDGATGAVTVHLVFDPQARPGQKVALNAGGREALPADVTTQTGSLDFVFPQLASGPQWIRLRVDGADSLLVDRSTTPPTFDGSQRLVIPA